MHFANHESTEFLVVVKLCSKMSSDSSDYGNAIMTMCSFLVVV